MYSIIIVDDETDVRKAVIDIIHWDQLGFRLAGEAGNGQEALMLIEEECPDVIITDIKMPYMDGIEFAKQVREINPVTKIVFLTGFNDFDYAVSAIKLNVIEYLLKPISAGKLAETLVSIKQKLDEEKQNIRNVSLLREGYERTIGMRRMSLLISMVTDENFMEPDEAAIQRMAGEYGLKLSGESFMLFTVNLDQPSFKSSKVPTDDLELIKFSVSNTIKSIAKKYLDSEIFILGSLIVGILSGSQTDLKSYADILIKEAHQSIAHFYGFTATIGVSGIYHLLKDSKYAYRSAVTAVNYRSALGEGRIIYLSDIENDKEFLPIFSSARDMQLCSIIKTGGEAALTAFVDEIFTELKDNNAGPESYRIILIEMYAAMLRAYKSVSGGGDEQIHIGLGFDDGLLGQPREAQRNWFLALCKKVMENIQNQQKSTAGVIAEKAYDYLKAHYPDSDMSLKKVSQELHISSSYFSAVFKKETGASFTEALIKVRMEAARELLLTTQLKVFEIAEKTGYTDQHYFSYCFKKYFGQSPNEMRAARTGVK